MCPGSNAMVIDADNDVGAELGQHVLIENKASNMLLAAFTVYILPLLVIGIGVFLGYYLSSQLPISAVFLMIAGGIIFAVPVLYIVKRFDRSMQSEKPVIVKTIK
jgi:Positive regulator of sigma E activity